MDKKLVTEGNVYDVKEAIMTHISEADVTLLPKASHVFPNVDLDIWQVNTTKMPVVAIKIGPANIIETAFGRQLGGSIRGNYIIFYFTLHVHHEVDSGSEPSKKAMDLTDKIITKLEQSADSASGIVHYDEITFREASGMHHGLARMIVEGYVFVRRPIS